MELSRIYSKYGLGVQNLEVDLFIFVFTVLCSLSNNILLIPKWYAYEQRYAKKGKEKSRICQVKIKFQNSSFPVKTHIAN